MITFHINKHIKWSETPFSGVKFCWLSEKLNTGRTALLKFDKNAELPLHNHPGWEQIYVIEGSLQINNQIFSVNDFVLIDAGTNHSVLALEPSKYITISEKEGVEIVKEN